MPEPRKISAARNFPKTLLILAGVLVAFLIAEIVLRSNPNLSSEGYQPSRNERLVYELAPHYFIKSLNARISSQGLNDRYFPKTKPPGIYRIAVAGDSTSFGLHVGPQKSFPKILERMLNEKLQGRFEVLNFSVPGYNTFQELELIRTKIPDYNPDMVVLVFDNNDIHLCNYVKPLVTMRNFLYVKSRAAHLILRQIDVLLASRDNSWMRRSWISFKKNILGMFYYDQPIYKRAGLEEAIYINGDPPLDKDKVPPKYWEMLGLENYKAHVLAISEFLKKKNIKFVSSGFFFEDGEDELRIHNELGIAPVCNFNEFLNRDHIPNSAVEHPQGHLNEHGHDLCARYLCETILKIVVSKKVVSVPTFAAPN